jgi:lysophospholipase L1-like esterase
MRSKKTLLSALALALLLPVTALAQVDFTRYVAFGDSLTAATSSGGLSRTYQVNSYPVLIYEQATGGRAGFEQPLVSAPGIPAVLELRNLAPLVIAPKPGRGQPANLLLSRPYNNMAVPGAEVHDLLATTTDNGGYHDLILRQTGFTQLQLGLSLNPTFVTLWIGNNDVLGAATSGRVIEGVTLTPVAQFEAEYRAAVAAIAQTGAEMAIANLPNVTSLPFVTTLPPVVVNPQTNQPVLVNGNPVPLIGPAGPLGPGDRVLLTASAELVQGRGIPQQLGGSGQPLSDGAVLSAAEVQTIQARVDAYNNVIRAVATERNAAFVDINATLRELATTGVQIGGITFSEDFLTGGVFSYDGVHPNAFGYAFIANLFIEAINDQFGADIPPVNLFPFIFGPLPNQSTAAVAAARAGAPEPTPGFVFTEEAARNLLWALGVSELPEAPRPQKPALPSKGEGPRVRPRD